SPSVTSTWPAVRECVPSASDHARASAICPTAAAAWLSSSLSAPAGSLRTARPSAIAPEETTSRSHLLLWSPAMSAASEASQSRLSAPAEESTSRDEPTLTTIRRKAVNDGDFDMVPGSGVKPRRLCSTAIIFRQEVRFRSSLGWTVLCFPDERCLHTFGRERHSPQPQAGCIMNRVGKRCSDRCASRLARANQRLLWPVDQLYVDLGHTREPQDRIARPVHAQDARAVEHHLFHQCPANRLQDTALDLSAYAVRIDDLPAIMRAGDSFD